MKKIQYKFGGRCRRKICLLYLQIPNFPLEILYELKNTTREQDIQKDTQLILQKEFKIIGVYCSNLIMYKIQDMGTDEKINGRFYERELSLVKKYLPQQGPE